MPQRPVNPDLMADIQKAVYNFEKSIEQQHNLKIKVSAPWSKHAEITFSREIITNDGTPISIVLETHGQGRIEMTTMECVVYCEPILTHTRGRRHNIRRFSNHWNPLPEPLRRSPVGDDEMKPNPDKQYVEGHRYICELAEDDFVVEAAITDHGLPLFGCCRHDKENCPECKKVKK